MAVVNFIFVYILTGFILSWVLLVLFKKDLHHRTLLYLAGYGMAPLLVSFTLNYLYHFFPHQQWWFYNGIIYSLWIACLLVLIYFRRADDFKNIKLSIRTSWQTVRRSSLTAKIVLGFIVLTVGFVFVRGQFYPNLWADAIYYFQQGHVYSIDRSLDRLTTLIPFSEDGSGYIMNPSIRPALPVLYSFFYTSVDQKNIFIFSGSFLYFYYFILMLGIFAYILKKFHFDYERILIGLSLCVSSYYLINFVIFGFKEIILTFFVLIALLISHLIAQPTTQRPFVWSGMLGALIGLSVFINLSGVIIGGVVGLVYLIELCATKNNFKKVLFSIIVTCSFIVLMSAGELKNDFTFFNQVKPTNVGRTEVNEYSAYRIVETPTPLPTVPEVSVPEVTTTPEVIPSDTATTPTISEVADPVIIDENIDARQVMVDWELKKQILLKGKFQAFTQPQFYGIIFLLFGAICIIRIIQKRKPVYFEKNVLGFFWIFFFVVTDPFFLNPHPQAYVLSISPKYVILLVPLAALFITMDYAMIIHWLAKIKLRYLLFSSVLILLLVPGIRAVATTTVFSWFEQVVPLYNTSDYYIHKFDLFSIGVGVLFLVLNGIVISLLATKASQHQQRAVVQLLSIAGGLIFPFLFLLNNNYPIIPIMRNLFASKATKIEISETNSVALAFLKTINYLNTETDQQTRILFLEVRPAIYHLEDYKRFVDNTSVLNQPVNASGKKFVDVMDANYIVIRSNELEQHTFTLPVEIDQNYGSTILLRVIR